MNALDPRIEDLVIQTVDKRLLERGIVDDEYLTFGEAHKYLKMGRTTFHKHVLDGLIPFRQIDRTHRGPVRIFHKSELDKLKESLK